MNENEAKNRVDTTLLTRLTRGGARTIDVLAAAVVLVGVFHVSINALSRWLLNHPIQNTLETTQYWYLPLIALLGLVTAMRRGEHIRAELLTDRFSARTQGLISGFTGPISVLLCGAITYFSFFEALDSMRIGLTAGATAITIWPVTFVVPLSFTVLTILFAARSLHELGHPGETSTDAANTEDVTLEHEA